METAKCENEDNEIEPPVIVVNEPDRVYCGALISEYDPDDVIFEHIARASDTKLSVPTSVDLRVLRSPRDQQNRDTCAAFAAAAVKEIHELADISLDTYMSPEFIYYHRENKPGHGMYGRNVFKILQQIGSVPEHMYPYGSTHQPPADLYEIAAQYKIGNYAKISTCYGLKNALAEIGPAYIVLPLYKNRPEFWRGTSGEGTGSHALCAVGFDEAGFILRNSWGPDWADGGYITFPYSDWHCVLECWISIDEKTIPIDIKEPKSPRASTDPIPTRKNHRRTKRRSLSETIIQTLSGELSGELSI